MPWKTISHAMSAKSDVAPGDTVFVRSGIYRESVHIQKNGLPSNPIVLTRYTEENPIVLTSYPEENVILGETTRVAG